MIDDREQLVLSSNLRRLMSRAGFTLSETAAATGVCEKTIKAMLRGGRKPHALTIHRLAAGLGVPADELFHGSSNSDTLSEQVTDLEFENKLKRVLNTPQRGLLSKLVDVLHEHTFGNEGGLS